MKLFILTHCAAEENYTPQVFLDKKAARKELAKIADQCIYERDEDGELLGSYTDNFELYDDAAEIIYSDDTYDRLDIFEIEVNLSKTKNNALLIDLLNDRDDMYGITNTIQYLLDRDFNKTEIEAFGYDKKDIEKAKEEDEQNYLKTV